MVFIRFSLTRRDRAFGDALTAPRATLATTRPCGVLVSDTKAVHL